MLDIDSKNAHIFCSRDKLEVELKLNMAFHYMLKSFRTLYGKTVTVQWYFGNGPYRLATNFHISCGGLIRQGNAPATIYFNALATRVYRKHLVLMKGREILFAITDDLNILAPPVVIRELAESFPTIALEEASGPNHSNSQELPHLRLAHSSSKVGTQHGLNPPARNSLTELPVHDIPDGSDERVDLFDMGSERIYMAGRG